jgi:hypothetical protein
LDKISEIEFLRLCNGILSDLDEIRNLNPSLSDRDVFHWMLLGTLVSLLSIPILEQPSVFNPSSADPYYDAVVEVLKGRCEPPFDPADHLRKIESSTSA